ncbi:MAG: hypothetical protein V1794_05670 [Candidatus Glassbacteria bacterium]
MTLGLALIAAILICLAIFGLAIMTFRHQRLLQEKKGMYLNAHKERSLHYRRYTTCQADLERLRVSFNNRLRELGHLKVEIQAKKKEIQDILDILREESKQVDEEMEKDLTRIIERRKGMILNHWKELNGKKALYLGKLKEAQTDKGSRQSLMEKKESEFQMLSRMNSELARLKSEYERIVRRPIFSFGSKK